MDVINKLTRLILLMNKDKTLIQYLCRNILELYNNFHYNSWQYKIRPLQLTTMLQVDLISFKPMHSISILNNS